MLRQNLTLIIDKHLVHVTCYKKVELSVYFFLVLQVLALLQFLDIVYIYSILAVGC